AFGFSPFRREYPAPRRLRDTSFPDSKPTARPHAEHRANCRRPLAPSGVALHLPNSRRRQALCLSANLTANRLHPSCDRDDCGYQLATVRRWHFSFLYEPARQEFDGPQPEALDSVTHRILQTKREHYTCELPFVRPVRQIACDEVNEKNERDCRIGICRARED